MQTVLKQNEDKEFEQLKDKKNKFQNKFIAMHQVCHARPLIFMNLI